MPSRFPVILAAAAALFSGSSLAVGQRATGIDVSAWQGDISQGSWNSAAASGHQFAFIRSSRGGTTGTYNQSTRVGTLSHRYDDPVFVQNMTRAKSAGLLVGPYHFARADLVLGKIDMNGFDSTGTSNGLDEANHFIEAAGQYMRPGYIRPVFDLEAGNTQRTTTELTAYAQAFSDRIFAVTGVRPIIYASTSYATSEVSSSLNSHSLWLARYKYTTASGYTDAQRAAAAAQVQVEAPPTPGGYANPYGIWNAVSPQWSFWQYTSDGRTPGFSGSIDQNVANGDIEFVKDFLVPALWFVNSDGQWTTASNWNGATVLPQPIDRVIVDRTGGTFTINLGSGTHSIRSLQMNENFTQSGGSLTVAQYANFTGNSTISGGSLTSATMANSALFTISGGAVTTGNVTGLGHLSIDGGTFKAAKINQGSVGILNGTLQLTGTAASRVSGFGITGTGKLDLGAAKLIVQAGPLSDLVNYLAAGKIMTSSGGQGAGVAYFLASDLFGSFPATFGGEPVLSGNYNLLARALRGDTNLSGTVDFNDLVSLAQSYGATGRWRNGDFNYDSTVDFKDLVSLAQNYGSTLLDNGTLVAGDGSNFASDWALAQSLAPEPSIALLILPALARRRRNR